MRARTVAPSTSAGLRARTREEHEAVEASLDMGQLRTSAGLAAALRGWQTVWGEVSVGVLEPGAAAEATAELLIPAAQALDWLAADLSDLAPPEGEVPMRCAAPSDARVLRRFLAHPAASWGLAYALRGSRLGGGVLAPLVRGALELPGDCGTRFLASHGTDPGREWVSFRRRLDAADLSEPEVAAAVEAARWTFRWVGAALAATSGRTALAGQASR